MVMTGGWFIVVLTCFNHIAVNADFAVVNGCCYFTLTVFRGPKEFSWVPCPTVATSAPNDKAKLRMSQTKNI